MIGWVKTVQGTAAMAAVIRKRPIIGAVGED